MTNKPSKRGFASMDPARQRPIASMGGKSVPAEKRAFAKNPLLASRAGRKGGIRDTEGDGPLPGGDDPSENASAKPFGGWLHRSAQ